MFYILCCFSIPPLCSSFANIRKRYHLDAADYYCLLMIYFSNAGLGLNKPICSYFYYQYPRHFIVIKDGNMEFSLFISSNVKGRTNCLELLPILT